MQIFFGYKAFFPVFLAIAILTAGCRKKEETTAATPSPPVRVAVTVIEGTDSLGVIDNERTYTGTVASSQTTVVSFSVAGTITELPIEEGQMVKKGELIGKVASGDYENAHNIAMAQLAEAQDAYNRLKKLHDADALPDVKWVEMEQKLQEARNEAEITKRTLSDATLYSPVTGTVSRKLASLGQNTGPGQPVYEIVSTTDLTINIAVPEGDIAGIAEGQGATIEFDDLATKPLSGKVKLKAVVADPLTRAYTVKISIPSSGNTILPGMVGRVKLSPRPKARTNPDGTIVLPAEAVQLDSDNTNFVWTVNHGRAERRPVKVNELVLEGVLIEAGLVKGDTVIIEGMSKVGSGSAVIPVAK